MSKKPYTLAENGDLLYADGAVYMTALALLKEAEELEAANRARHKLHRSMHKEAGFSIMNLQENASPRPSPEQTNDETVKPKPPVPPDPED